MKSWKLMHNAISFTDRLKLAKFALFTNQFTNGPKVKELESKWNDWLGSKYSLFVSSGSTANFLLIASLKEYLGLKNGDKVLVPACTWMTNVAPIIQLGLQPIFCDINLKDFSFDETELKYIAKKHKDIKLIFVTHLLGFSSQTRIKGTLENYFPKAKIIDDVCESHGCSYDDGSKVGANSLGATYSGYWGHHLTSIEGGIVSTYDEELYDLMKMKRSHGMARESKYYDKYASENEDVDKQFLFMTDGYNFRSTDLNAVLGISQLSKLDKSIKIRNDNYKLFCDLVGSYNNLLYPIAYSETSSNFCLPFICLEQNIKTKLIKEFNKNNIEYRPVVSGNLLKHPFLKDYKLETKKVVTNVDIIHTDGLYIGNNQFINKKHLLLLEHILENL